MGKTFSWDNFAAFIVKTCTVRVCAAEKELPVMTI